MGTHVQELKRGSGAKGTVPEGGGGQGVAAWMSKRASGTVPGDRHETPKTGEIGGAATGSCRENEGDIRQESRMAGRDPGGKKEGDTPPDKWEWRALG